MHPGRAQVAELDRDRRWGARAGRRNPAGAPVTLLVHPGHAQVAELDRDRRWVRALDGTEYMPGLVGLNNMKANDYANAVVQVPHMQGSRVSCAVKTPPPL